MIAALMVGLPMLAAVPLLPVAVKPAPLPAPAAILARYSSALGKLQEPRVISFDYTLEQSGRRTLAQTHRVFRDGSDERDETLTVDGRPLQPPKVRIFRGRRNRYTLALLAPRVGDYNFTYIGPRKDARHVDYVFRLTPKTMRPFVVTDLTIDGVRFLPVTIGFATGKSRGAGSIAFGSNARWWVPYAAAARALVATDIASEHLTFYTYRFPRTLPPSTFGRTRAIVPKPAASSVPRVAPPKAPVSFHRSTSARRKTEIVPTAQADRQPADNWFRRNAMSFRS